MSIVNDFKKILKTETDEAASKKKTSVVKKPVNAKKVKAVREGVSGKAIAVKKTSADKKAEHYKVLKYPLITEKTTDLSMLNQYIFVIDDSANKNEVKKAFESVYGVKVTSVNIINIPRKKRTRGRILGWKSGFKKAVITVKEGDKVEIVSH